MKIFISWSGERSKAVATALKEWLPDIFQADEIFMSAHDIEAGARWGVRLNSELKQSHFGIVCLTPENLAAPWILFEAGALSKAFEESHVIPYLLELKTTDVTGPLSQFNNVVANQEGTFKLLETINQLREKALPPEQLKKLFSKWWSDLKDQLTIIPSVEVNKIPQRKDRELLEEILQIVRSQDKNSSNNLSPKRHATLSEVKRYIETIIDFGDTKDEAIMHVLNNFDVPMTLVTTLINKEINHRSAITVPKSLPDN